jgi:cbb3-type cytochrome oxidase maturation protein
MIIVVLLIAISLLIALVFLGIFHWSIRSGQYDDLYTPSVRMLFDDEEAGEGGQDNSGVKP